MDLCGWVGFLRAVTGSSNGSRRGCGGALIAFCFARGGLSVMLQ
jgi:hypothetical protein